MKLLIVTNLFPNAAEPNRAPFNRQQFTALAKLCELKVVAPIPMFRHSRKQVPEREVIGGIEVFHPRYLAIPKILRITHGPAYFLGIWHTLRTIQRTFDYDAILAAWAYPDAYGAALAARILRKKLIVEVLGSDINFAHQYWLRPAMIRWALSKAERVIAVSRPLKYKVAALGVPEDKITVIANGVNKDVFYFRQKVECRRALGLEAGKKYILYVGNLVEVKGVEYLVRAFRKLSGDQSMELLIVGDGELRKSLEGLAEDLGTKEQVRFKGRRPYDEVPLWLNAADVFCLPSLNEGCPNVVLEALACGTKIVASNVGGVSDIIDAPAKGWLAKACDPDDLARQLKSALEAPTSTSAFVTKNWDDNAKALFEVLNKA